jgi:ubiquinol-cytochrome c reductase subunit 8
MGGAVRGTVRYIGEWGTLGPKVKGIVTYSLSPNEQRVFGGVLSHGIQNMWRRFSSEFFNVAPALLLTYGGYYWAESEHRRLKRKDPKKYENEQ